MPAEKGNLALYAKQTSTFIKSLPKVLKTKYLMVRSTQQMTLFLHEADMWVPKRLLPQLNGRITHPKDQRLLFSLLRSSELGRF